MTQGVRVIDFSFFLCFVDSVTGHLHVHKRHFFLASCLANFISREILPKILQDVYISRGVTDTTQFCCAICVFKKLRENLKENPSGLTASALIHSMNMRSQGYHFFSANQKRHTVTGLAIHEKVHLYVTNYMKWKKGRVVEQLIRCTTSLKRRPLYKGHLYNGHMSSANITV